LKKIILFVIAISFFSVSNAQRTSYLQLNTIELFKRIEAEPLTTKYGGVTAVKVVYCINTKDVYFLDSKLYRFHYDFCFKELGESGSLYDFNKANYSPGRNREYVFATVNRYPSQNFYTLEFACTEAICSDDIACYNAVVKNSFCKNLKFFVATDKQLAAFQSLHTTTPYALPDEVYKGLIYQPIIEKECFGYLKKVDVQQIDKTVIKAEDILLTNGTPFQVPVVAGIMTTSFQAPLSHVCILAQNRKTPLMACKTLWNNAYINSLVGKPVYLVIRQDSFSISLTTDERVKKYFAQQKKKSLKPIELKRNLTVDSMVDARKLSYASVNFAGGKASNMGELFKTTSIGVIDKINLPEKPFVIPLYFYVQHLSKNKIDMMVNELLQDSVTLANDSILRLQLKKIRKAITKAKLDSSFLTKLTLRLQKNYTTKNFRFRSSTNAEDIDGFNGAGLYDSKTGIVGDSNKSIEHAIKAVWASTFSERAFKERRYFNMNQKNVAMALLVHPAFGTENINAVAITKNLYRSDYPAYVVNLQKGETPVVGSPDSVTYEQIILYDKSNDELNNNIVIEYLSYSSLNNNKPLLNNKQYEELYNTLHAIKKYYFYKIPQIKTGDYYDFAMDVELKWIGANNKLIVKQARVYNH
jgi:hypothetical protein